MGSAPLFLNPSRVDAGILKGPPLSRGPGGGAPWLSPLAPRFNPLPPPLPPPAWPFKGPALRVSPFSPCRLPLCKGILKGPPLSGGPGGGAPWLSPLRSSSPSAIS